MLFGQLPDKFIFYTAHLLLSLKSIPGDLGHRVEYILKECQLISGRNHTHTHSHSTHIIEIAVSLQLMSLERTRKPEYLEETPNERTCKLQAHRAEAGIKPPTAEMRSRLIYCTPFSQLITEK